MRILKYLFLLLLLSMVTVTIFIATQKGDFTVERSKIINSPKAVVFNYVNDNKNWEDWNSLAFENSEIKLTNSQNTIGNGSLLTWEGNIGSGDLQTLYVKENDSIFQKMNYNGNSTDIFWIFKDTLGITKVTCRTKGKMSFSNKILTVINGGANDIFGKMFEKNLVNLDKKLDFEINTYTIKVNGLANKLENFYLAQKFTSTISNVSKNTRIVIAKITLFCKKNNIIVNGKPFVIYHTYDTVNELTKLSICVPIKDKIFITEGSDILSEDLKSFQAVKTTLTGDYSHNKEALNKTLDYINVNHLRADGAFSHLEIYSIGKTEMKSPSKWITEIYIPVVPKVVMAKPIAIDTTKTEVITPKKEVITPKKEVITPKKELVAPKKEVVNPKKEVVNPKKSIEKEIPSEF